MREANNFYLQMTVFYGMRGRQVICFHINNCKRSSFDSSVESCCALQRLACHNLMQCCRPNWTCELTVSGGEVGDITVSYTEPLDPSLKTFKMAGRNESSENESVMVVNKPKRSE